MEKELQLLHSRLQKIEERNFDLNNWKKGTIAVLDSILGQDNLKRKLIEDIDFQNNSWSLRDTTGDVDSVKKTCADVLETIILELETLGMAEKIVPDSKPEVSKGAEIIKEALSQELSQSQLDDVLKVLHDENVSADMLVDKFKRLGYEVAPRILAKLLLNSEVKKSL